ncbi:hypothetical protein Ddye_031838 [Dipteronia dyeriana]|uniref:endo-polygalacturonase n=1 Tax=Dipteronia dyeriana TaxID=168575 RepID=A0AAD9TJB0_9ROSI|nr:hypothetical protein Ddye_031838 [Dipteronia dyeriana]
MFSKSCLIITLYLINLVSFSSSTFGSYLDYHYDNPNPATLNSVSGTKSSSSFRRSFFKTRPLASASSPSSAKVVNVDSFGAKGDGTDDSQAFKRAWQEACSSSNEAVLVVPKNKMYLLKPLRLSGPCKSSLTMKIYGTIKASVRLSDYQKDPDRWIVFENVNNFRVDGSGTIDGSGRIWWQNSCKINKNLPCKDAPTAVTFSECNNLVVASLRFKNSQKMHLTFQKCVNVRALNLLVIAPGKSPNTDGIHVTGTRDILIKNCVIRTGDDCISIVSGSKNVRATDITCGPGHGISIGSLGAGNSEAEVSDVVVNRARFSGTTNGVRIKTWQGGSGYAKNIIFQNIAMYNVSNPIIIDQHYCDQNDPCPDQGSAVRISNVAYKNIRGTSASELAIKFDCSKHFACQGILVQDVTLTPQIEDSAQASCVNVKLQTVGSFSPRCS